MGRSREARTVAEGIGIGSYAIAAIFQLRGIWGWREEDEGGRVEEGEGMEEGYGDCGVRNVAGNYFLSYTDGGDADVNTGNH